jgi:RNA polymerase sigma factor (sigma-70 family)
VKRAAGCGGTREKDVDDLVLLERWRRGERQAGQELFSRHFDEIYRFFEHKSGSEVDELVQRTFLACVAARDDFRSQSTFRTYLFTIARHELYAHYGRKAREPVDVEVTSIAQIVTSPSGRLGRAQEADALRAALAALPADQQLLLELHYWHDLDAAAVGEVFEVSPGTIRVRLLRARRALRGQLLRMGRNARPDPRDQLAASLEQADLDEAQRTDGEA